MLKVTNDFLNEIRVAQGHDMELQQFIEWLGIDKGKDYQMEEDGILCFKGRVCMPGGPLFRRQILKEGHQSRLSIHPGMTKMYKDLKESFWWNGMKSNVADFIAQCLVCQKAKIEHQRPGGTLQPLEIPQWKWDTISMDFVTHLSKSTKGHDSVWVIVDRLTNCAHFLPINQKWSMDKLAETYIREVVRLHGVP